MRVKMIADWLKLFWEKKETIAVAEPLPTLVVWELSTDHRYRLRYSRTILIIIIYGITVADINLFGIDYDDRCRYRSRLFSRIRLEIISLRTETYRRQPPQIWQKQTQGGEQKLCLFTAVLEPNAL